MKIKQSNFKKFDFFNLLGIRDESLQELAFF